jgi:hypothetical protein
MRAAMSRQRVEEASFEVTREQRLVTKLQWDGTPCGEER